MRAPGKWGNSYQDEVNQENECLTPVQKKVNIEERQKKRPCVIVKGCSNIGDSVDLSSHHSYQDKRASRETAF